MPEFVKVSTIGDPAPGRAKVVEAKGIEVALVNHEGSYYALSNSCLHMGGPVGEGECSDGVITCPWHGWGYRVSDGANTENPAARLRTYPVRVDGRDILVQV